MLEEEGELSIVGKGKERPAQKDVEAALPGRYRITYCMPYPWERLI
jgi:hypothetical protein